MRARAWPAFLVVLFIAWVASVILWNPLSHDPVATAAGVTVVVVAFLMVFLGGIAVLLANSRATAGRLFIVTVPVVLVWMAACLGMIHALVALTS